MIQTDARIAINGSLPTEKVINTVKETVNVGEWTHLFLSDLPLRSLAQYTGCQQDNKHDQKMDEGILELHRMSQFQERSDSWKAFILVFGILIAVLYLLINGQLAEAGVLGTVFVGLAAIARAFRRKS